MNSFRHMAAIALAMIFVGCKSDNFSGGGDQREGASQTPPGSTLGPNGQPIPPGSQPNPIATNPPGGVATDGGSTGSIRVPLVVVHDNDDGGEISAGLRLVVDIGSVPTELVRFTIGAPEATIETPSICTCGVANEFNLRIEVNSQPADAATLINQQILLGSSTGPTDSSDWRRFTSGGGKPPKDNKATYYLGGFDHTGNIFSSPECPAFGLSFQCTEGKWDNADDVQIAMWCKLSDCPTGAEKTTLRFKGLPI